MTYNFVRQLAPIVHRAPRKGGGIRYAWAWVAFWENNDTAGELLVRALGSRFAARRAFAAKVLGEMGYRAAIPMLREEARRWPDRNYADSDTFSAQIEAIQALGTLKDREALPVLLEQLEIGLEKDPTLAWFVIRTIVEMGATEAAESVRSMNTTNGVLAKQAKLALEGLECGVQQRSTYQFWPYFELLKLEAEGAAIEERSLYLCYHANMRAKDFGFGAVLSNGQYAAFVLTDTPRSSCGGSVALRGRRWTSATGDEFFRLRDSLILMWRGREHATGEWYAIQLENEPHMLEWLHERFRNAIAISTRNPEQIRNRAIEILDGTHKWDAGRASLLVELGSTIAPILIDRLSSHGHTRNSVVAYALGAMGAREAIPALIRAADRPIALYDDHENEYYTQVAAIHALGDLGAVEAVPTLLAILQDALATDVGASQFVIPTLGRLGGESVEGVLRSLLTHDDEGVVKDARAALETMRKRRAQDNPPQR